MGAWGTGSFENDEALDWLGDLADSNVPEMLEGAFKRIVASPGYLEAQDCTAAIAAAEIVAAAMGRPCDRFPDEAIAIAQRLSAPGPDMVKNARTAVLRVLRESELRELWQDSDSFAEWDACVRGLEVRLAPTR